MRDKGAQREPQRAGGADEKIEAEAPWEENASAVRGQSGIQAPVGRHDCSDWIYVQENATFLDWISEPKPCPERREPRESQRRREAKTT